MLKKLTLISLALLVLNSNIFISAHENTTDIHSHIEQESCIEFICETDTSIISPFGITNPCPNCLTGSFVDNYALKTNVYSTGKTSRCVVGYLHMSEIMVREYIKVSGCGNCLYTEETLIGSEEFYDCGH